MAAHKKDYKRSADAIAEAASRIGHRVEDTRLIGQDPGDGCVRSVCTTCPIDSPESHYVFDVHDWTMAPSKADRARGAELSTVAGCLGHDEALQTELRRAEEVLSRYTWYVPGTEDPVPGCRVMRRA